MRLVKTATVLAVLALAVSTASADLAVNQNLGTLSAGTTNLVGTTVGGANNASSYSNSNAALVWANEFVYQFTTLSPFTVNLTSNDPNAPPIDNDFFLLNSLTTIVDVSGRTRASGAIGTLVEQNGPLSATPIPAGTYYLSIDAFQGSPTTGVPAPGAFNANLVLASFVAPPAPASTAVVVGGSVTGSLAAGQVNFYSFTTAGGALSFNTEGTTLSATNDTELFLFNSAGVQIATDDDSGTGNLSLLNATVAAGTYYLGFGAFNTSSGPNFLLTSTSTQTGNFIINGISVVPEPTTLASLALGGLLVRRRRSI